jgi:penicillin-binding protein-related factor A (putative recombinase)
MKNRGTEFEKRLGKIHDVYKMLRVAKIEKVAPPILVLGKKKIMLANPYLDFAGAWTEENGRAVAIEAKLTEVARLSICRDGGLSENQYSNLWAWRDAGAAVGLLWFYTEANTVRFVSLSRMAEIVQRSDVSIKWNEAEEIPASYRCPWDYLPLMKKELAAP